MTGLRRALLFLGSCSLLLSSCGPNVKDAPPIAGTVTTSDPAAAALYARAQAADQAGQTKDAIKLYEKTAELYPYAEVAPPARLRQATLLESLGNESPRKLLDAFDAYQELISRYPSSSLYTQARNQQAIVAYAAADGVIKSNFLGLKSTLETKKIVEMLTLVRDNAPRAASAPKAQFTMGQVLEGREKVPEAIAAFQIVVDDYAQSPYAPESQYRIGAILLDAAEGGNQNQANLDKARHTFEDLIQQFPNSKRAGDAKNRIAEIGGRDIQRSFDVAEFYYKKGETTSAAFYYNEVLRKAKSGDLHDRAQARLSTINAGTT